MTYTIHKLWREGKFPWISTRAAYTATIMRDMVMDDILKTKIISIGDKVAYVMEEENIKKFIDQHNK